MVISKQMRTVKRRPMMAWVLTLLAATHIMACAPKPSLNDRWVETELPNITWPSGEHYVIDSSRSEMRVQLDTAGPLAAFGHAHVIGTQKIMGRVTIAKPWEQSAFELSVRVDDLIVDPSDWRQEAGLDPALTDAAIAGTTANMRSSTQLNATAHPIIQIQSRSLEGTREAPRSTVMIAVAGHITEQDLPMTVHWGDGELVVSGGVTWRLIELGIEPFKALGGGLSVADEIQLHFQLYAITGKDQSIGNR
jgi:polyisoprenoid-binding protein YceI